MDCHIPKWPVANGSFKLGGRSWHKAVESLLKLTASFPMVILLGRAGMGKTQVALEVCRKSDCIYVDLMEIRERDMANIVAAVTWRLLAKYGRKEVKNKVVEVYRKHRYEGLLSLARGDPTWTLQTALELVEGRVVIALDELLPSSEDPKFFEAAYVLHRIRNMNLHNASFLVTMLPEVYEKMVEKVPPLGNFFSHITVQLPDVVPRDEVEEIVSLYCLERGKEALRILEERPDATIRDILLELHNSSPRRYVEIPID
ncbi:MAG: AAA family ATPase [Pyrobaculum sp.]